MYDFLTDVSVMQSTLWVGKLNGPTNVSVLDNLKAPIINYFKKHVLGIFPRKGLTYWFNMQVHEKLILVRKITISDKTVAKDKNLKTLHCSV